MTVTVTTRCRLRVVATAGLAVVALLGSGENTVSAAAPGPACAESTRVFAVDAGSGHLVEIRACSDEQPELGPAVEVDSGDWRSYPTVFGVRDGEAAILYAVTATGVLWWWRQDGAGGGLSDPVRVGGGADWRHDVGFAAGPGHLEFGDYGGPVRTFRHDGWASGGTEVSEEGQLFAVLHGPRVTAVAPESGYAVGTWEGVNYRVWLDPGGAATGHDDTWYASGDLPAGVSEVVGDGRSLYGVAADGGVVLLRQQQHAACRRFERRVWFVGSRVEGHFTRVVVPVGGDPGEPPVIDPPPPVGELSALLCGGGSTYWPWEWQG